MSLEMRTDIILELGFPGKALPPLKAYIDLLWKSNEELNLFSRKMVFSELIDNHLIDCLLPLKNFPTHQQLVADFGSGGGFPGVLYALAFPDIQFHLFEKSPKKRAFLNQCQSIAQNIHIFGEIPPQLPGIDLVTSRAFKPLDVILDMSRDYFLAGGRYFLLKGRKEKIDEEIQLATKKFKTLKTNMVSLTSPVLDVERHLVII